ncbi:hypothetical protein Taro_001898 [Colocasia esculenta]|uniref:Uncharacterized protein n=1 Tax=Colocasia esculenta TaxID=4460 RepID=A0A843TCI0_COLES|nr:hypothetical protein [Colocasia esculenta]
MVMQTSRPLAGVQEVRSLQLVSHRESTEICKEVITVAISKKGVWLPCEFRLRAAVCCSCCCVTCVASVVAECVRAVMAWLALDSLGGVFLASLGAVLLAVFGAFGCMCVAAAERACVWCGLHRCKVVAYGTGRSVFALLVVPCCWGVCYVGLLCGLLFVHCCVLCSAWSALLLGLSRCSMCHVASLVKRCDTCLWLLSAWCWLVMSSVEVLPKFFSVGSGRSELASTSIDIDCESAAISMDAYSESTTRYVDVNIPDQLRFQIWKHLRKLSLLF